MKRFNALRYIILVCFILLSARVYTLSVVNGQWYKRKAVAQQSVVINSVPDRKDIYDRYMRCMTTGGKQKFAAIVKSEISENDFLLCEKIDNENKYALYNELHKKGIITTQIPWNFDKETIKDFTNVKIYEGKKRYSDEGVGAVTLGYISDGNGVCGIENLADNLLKNNYSSDFLINTASGKLLPGAYEKNPNPSEELFLKTTLDSKYMSVCQDALKNVKGSAVLLDVENFDLVAMVSSPTFNPNEIERYLNDDNNPLLNRAVLNYDMGSIFKIIVTASALENKSVNLDDVYSCNGVKKINEVSFLCENHQNMAQLTIFDAFIYSCNSVFIDIGQKTGYNNIIDTAEKFGLSEKLIYPYEFMQNKGTLPDKNNYYLADVANLSIGQGKMTGTAVHGAYLSAVIASGGLKKSINILDSMCDSYGNKKIDLKKHESERIISEKNAQIIKEMMRKTVTKGTGKLADSNKVSCAGKTGSAQTGMKIGEDCCVHAWFTGFFPVESPRYALCIFVENGKSGGSVAAPIFKEIAEKIALIEGW